MKKAGIILSIAAFIAVASNNQASAAGNCEIVYGGGEVCPPSLTFTIDKKVQTPSTKGGNGSYVDNMTVNDVKYAPESTINFQITIKNTGNKRIGKINVTDTLPSYLTFEKGVGNYDTTKKTLTFSVENLDPDKSVVYTIVTKAVKANELPSDQGVTCVNNNVQGVAEDKAVVNDTAQVCIEKQVVGTKPQVMPAPKTTTTPATGPEALALIGLIPSGLAGFYLRKRASK